MSDDQSLPADSEYVQTESVEYFRSFEYIWENPQWLTNVLLYAVCQLIPIVGPIVMMGYQYDVAESLIRSRGTSYTDFDFDKFVHYLLRGLWPFLVAMVVAIVLMIPLFIGGMFAVIILPAVIKEQDAGLAVVGVGGLVLFVAFVITNFYSTAMCLRAGLAQDFMAAFEFGAVQEFVSLMWLEMLLESLFLMIAGPILFLAGFIVCFIGVYISAAILMMAQAHLFYYQLYVIYLARGGTPVRFKESDHIDVTEAV